MFKIKNPKFKPMNKVTTVSDLLVPEQIALVGKHIEQYVFEVTDTKILDQESLLKKSHSKKRLPNQELKFIFSRITKPVDLEFLMESSKEENRQLHQDLQSGMGLTEALYHNSLIAIRPVENIHTLALDDELREKYDNGEHLIVLLNKNNLVAPLLFNHDGEIAYHFVGKGCKYYGASDPFNKHSDNTPYVSVVPVKVIDDQDGKTQNNFIREIIDHEFRPRVCQARNIRISRSLQSPGRFLRHGSKKF